MRDINSGEDLLNMLYKNLYLEYKRKDNSPPSERIGKLLRRLEDVTKKTIKKEKYDLLKKMYYNKYVIKEIPESYFKLQEKIALEQGRGNIYFNDYMKEEAKKTIIQDQKDSLDVWLDYFNSADAPYPTWAKYWAFQGMLKLGSYNKETGKFSKRTKSTTSMFVDLNREALALSIDHMQKFIDDEEKLSDEKLNELIESGSFQKIYEYISKSLSFEKHEYNTTEGIWIKYERRSDPAPLVKSLEGKGTGWCTAGASTAKSQLEKGDFHVYYSKDENGEYTNPRIAIRMEYNSIAEVRGIAAHQNLEQNLEGVLDEKLNEFHDKAKYMKRMSDTKILTHIDNKVKASETLTKDEISFLYELKEEITGFGNERDPRIDEILNQRNLKKDISFVLDVSEDEVSNKKEDLFGSKRLRYYKGDIEDSEYFEPGFLMPYEIKGRLILDREQKAKDISLPTIMDGIFCMRCLSDAKGLTLPTEIRGTLRILKLKSAKGLVLPKELNADLDLRGLESAKDLTLPTKINGDLYLSDLESTEGLELPKEVDGTILLSSLENAEGLEFPTKIGGGLDLEKLKKANGLVLPKEVNGSVILSSLESAEGLKLPDKVGYKLNLSRLKNTKGLTLPSEIRGSVLLNSLKSTENLVFPDILDGNLELLRVENCENTIFPRILGGDLSLADLKRCNDVTLPTNIDGNLRLWSLETIEGLTLPTTVGKMLLLKSVKNADDSVLPRSVGSILFDSLESAKGMVLPNVIEKTLQLGNLPDTEGLVIPDDFTCKKIVYKQQNHTTEEFKGIVNIENELKTSINLQEPHSNESEIIGKNK